MGFSSLPKVGASSLPVVLLFGKMNGERRQQDRAAGICTDDLGRGKGCSKEVGGKHGCMFESESLSHQALGLLSIWCLSQG